MPLNKCVVPDCKGKGGHAFPKDNAMRDLWLIAINRPDLQVKAWSTVCSKHFSAEDYFSETYNGGMKPLKKFLKKGAVPKLIMQNLLVHSNGSVKENEAESDDDTNQITQIGNRRNPEDRPEIEIISNAIPIQSSVPDVSSNTDPMPKFPSNMPELNSVIVCEDANVGVEYEIGTELEECKKFENDNFNKTISSANKFLPWKKIKKLRRIEKLREKKMVFSVSKIKHDDKKIHFYTGLESFQKFMFVFRTLGPEAYNLKYFYCKPPEFLLVEDFFFMTLMILRLHRTYYEISDLFGTTICQVSNIFITWIKFMYLQWKQIPLWPSKDLVSFYSPFVFKDQYPNTRIIVDGTECPILKPKNPKAQQASFSTYKNRNTVKVLVGMTPKGLSSYISESYAGSTTDRQITERCDLAKILDFGDEVMADKGFDVQDILAAYGVKLNIPSFFKKINRMDGIKLAENKKISKLRVHVERIIGLSKTYNILCEPMCHSEILLSSEITFICFMLCNFRKGIINS